jgi:phosphoesterase RecJ-like protein
VNGSASTIADALRGRHSFVLTSHARPDGDAIGSSMALALALEALGKRVRVVLRDPVPAPYRVFPQVERIEQRAAVSEAADAAVFLECGDIDRAGITGIAQHFIVNIDHHLGDASAAACGEQVADVIDALGVAWTADIASHLFLALSTDTGGFRFGAISGRTFEICRRITEAGVDVPARAREIFDSFSIGRIRLTGAMLNAMELHHGDRAAVLELDDALLARCGATLDDADGLVNQPLGARDVLVSVLVKREDAGSFRVSLRSKGDVDVRAIALRWAGGGHRNAAGCTVAGALPEIKAALVQAIGQALDAARS